MYLWTPLVYTRTGTDSNGKPYEVKRFAVGSEISKGSMSDEDWDYLVKTGAIREDEYPVKNLDATALESPREVIVREARQAMERAQQGMNLMTGRVERPAEG